MNQRKSLILISFLSFLTLPASIVAAAEEHFDHEIDRVLSLISPPKAALDDDFHRLARSKFQDWLQARVSGDRGARVTEALRCLHPDDRAGSPLAQMVMMVRRVENLVRDADTVGSVQAARLLRRALDPRGYVLLAGARAARAEYRFLRSLFGPRGPGEIYDAIFAARSVKPIHRHLLHRILAVTHATSTGVRVDLDDDLAAEIERTCEGDARARGALIRELNANDIALLIRVEKTSERAFVVHQLWARHKAAIATEFAIKGLGASACVAALTTLLR